MSSAELFNAITALPSDEKAQLFDRLGCETDLSRNGAISPFSTPGKARNPSRSMPVSAASGWKYRVVMLALRFKRSAEEELVKLPARKQKRIGEQLLALRGDPLPAGCIRLQGGGKAIAFVVVITALSIALIRLPK